MVPEQRQRIRARKCAIYDHGKHDPPLLDRVVEPYTILNLALLSLPENKVEEAQYNEIQSENGGGSHEREEVPVVAAPDAVVKPDTVVVLGFDAVIADAAVVAARRAPDAAGAAIFYGDFEVDLGGFRGLDKGPAVGRGYGERVVFVICFEGVDITWVDLGGVSTRCGRCWGV